MKMQSVETLSAASSDVAAIRRLLIDRQIARLAVKVVGAPVVL